MKEKRGSRKLKHSEVNKPEPKNGSSPGSAAKPQRTPEVQRRPSIGLMLDTFFENYEIDIWHGVVDYAAEKSVDLICFVGGSLRSPYYHYSQRNAVYDLISPENVDGLISVSGSIATWINIQELEEFYRKFTPLPLVSIGARIAGGRSVLVDNVPGMRELMEHLIVGHNYKSIAYISGPRENPDALVRFEIYKQTLEEHGLSFDTRLVVAGDFQKSSAGHSLSVLLDERRMQCDAIVAANDYVAIEIIRNLKHRGYQVPRDIAVVGFDNIDESRYLAQPLTTVRQPAYELGQKALEMLLAEVAGAEVPGELVLSTSLIKRRSCGCFLNKELQVRFNEDLYRQQRSPGEISCFQQEMIAGVVQFMEDNFIKFKNEHVKSDWAGKLIYALFDDLHNVTESHFLATLENIVTEAIIVDIEVLTWHKIIIEIFSRLKGWITRPEENKFLDSLFRRCLEMIWEIAVRSLTYLKLKAEEKDELLFAISQAFITVFDLKKLEDIIRKELPPLGIRDCFISLYKSRQFDREQAVLVVASQSVSGAGPFATPVEFKPTQLIPGGFRPAARPRAHIVMSLYYKDEQLGFALFDIGSNTGNVYETLVVQISSALKGIRLLGEVQEHAISLEAKVKARTLDLHKINERLKEEIGERKRTAEILQKKNEKIQQLNRELEEKSRIDDLTRLYNREAFFTLLEKEFKRTNRNNWRMADNTLIQNEGTLPDRKVLQNQPSGEFHEHIGALSIMLVDIDDFKLINDNYGHLVGDVVLRALGSLFLRKDILRREDFVGRYGGEEFIIVCPNTNARNALDLGKRLANEFRGMEFNSNDSGKFFVTLSIGIAEYNQQDGDAISVINRADKAMYHAKQRGKNRIEVYKSISSEK